MNNEDVRVKIWRVIYPVLIYIIVNIVVQAFFMVIATLNYRPSEVIIDGQVVVNDLTTSIEKYSNLVGLFSALITILIVYRLSKNEFITDIKQKLSKKYLILIPLALLANTGLSRMVSLFSLGDISNSYKKIEEVFFSGSIAVQFLALVVVIPIMEEMIFRGMVYNRIKEYTGSLYAGAMISSLMFALYHFDLLQGIYTFLLGILLVYIYERYKNIMAPMILHMITNFFAIILSYSGISGFLSRNIFVYIFLMLIELSGLVVLILIIGRRK